MAVPEAAMDEDYRPIASQDYVRRSREVASVEGEAEAPAMEEGADRELRLRVLGLDPGHEEGAVGGLRTEAHTTSTRRGGPGD